jgi:D-aspartate ligase
MRNAKLPVVLLGGLDVTRALGLAGIPVIVASSERCTLAMASRYCDGVIELPPITERDAVVSMLVRAGREFVARYGRPVPLFYDNDDRLALVQDYRAALAPHFRILLNAPELADALIHKVLFQELAERRGLPVPRRIEWDALGREDDPVLVKPKSRTGWEQSSVRLQLFGGRGKARVFANGREARANALVEQLVAQLSFQEYIPGGDDAIWSFHGFCARDGELLGWFVGRKIRTFPALTGQSSYVQLARHEELVALGRDIARHIGLVGVFKMDFKRRPDGRFCLLEINPRFNLWHHLGARNGVNLPEVAYHHLLGHQRPLHAEARLLYRWLALSYDRRAYREVGLSRTRWIASLLEAPKVYAVFSWSDPMPFVRYWRKRLRAAFLRRMFRWLATAS